MIQALVFLVATLCSAPSHAKADSSLKWVLKAAVDVEGQSVLDPNLLQDQVDRAAALRQQALHTANDILMPLLEKLSRLSQGQAQLDGSLSLESLLQAQKRLADLTRRLQQEFPGVHATVNLVLVPWRTDDLNGGASLSLVDGTFAAAAITQMQALQTEKYGKVRDGKEPFYLMGATASLRLTRDNNVVQLQVVAGLNPQRLEGDPQIDIREVDTPTDSTALFLTIEQPQTLPLPILRMAFGKVGVFSRHDDQTYLFSPSNLEILCSRNQSAPTLLKVQEPLPMAIPLPLYDVSVDMNSQTITAADVRLGALGLCINPFGLVSETFRSQANMQLEGARSLVKSLLGASPEEFADMISKLREKSP